MFTRCISNLHKATSAAAIQKADQPWTMPQRCGDRPLGEAMSNWPASRLNCRLCGSWLEIGEHQGTGLRSQGSRVENDCCGGGYSASPIRCCRIEEGAGLLSFAQAGAGLRGWSYWQGLRVWKDVSMACSLLALNRLGSTPHRRAEEFCSRLPCLQASGRSRPAVAPGARWPELGQHSTAGGQIGRVSSGASASTLAAATAWTSRVKPASSGS